MLRTDLKIFKSERMTQQADAGGQRTSIQVQNGKLNDVFGNISDIDHAQAAVDIVKVYPAVSTNDTAMLQDGHILVNEPPIDPLVDVLLIESSGINDGSERTDVIELIESGVTPAAAIRTGLSAMVAGQNTINYLDLQSSAAPSGEQGNVTIYPGDIIAFSVEYPGAEDPAYPRGVHYAKALNSNVINTSYQLSRTSYVDVNFEPALPFAIPGRSTQINGQSRCGVLRRVTSNSDVKYHGVTRLTESYTGTSTQLPVEKTTANVLPRITKIENRLNVAPFGTAQQLLRKSITIPASGVIYSVDILDFSNLPQNEISILYITGGRPSNAGIVSLTDTTASIQLDYMPDAGTVITLSYYSSEKYTYYSFPTDTMPADHELLLQTVDGTVELYGQVFQCELLEQSDTFVTARVTRGTIVEICARMFSDGTGFAIGNYDELKYTAVAHNVTNLSNDAIEAQFTVDYAEFVVSSLYIAVEAAAGGLITASADENGAITGVGITGTIVNGYVELIFENPVKLQTLRYNVDEITVLTPPSTLYGINALRLANAGEVNIFRPFGVICVSNNQYYTYPSLAAAQVITLRPNAFVDITDSTGASLWHPLDTHFAYDKATGEVTITDVTGFIGPFEVVDTLSELALVTGVEDYKLTLASPLVNEYPAESTISSVLNFGDLQARVTNLFDQEIWDGNFSDIIFGAPAAAGYNNIDYPIELVNQSAINERWVIQFTSSSAFRCLGENVGQVAIGDTLTDFAPINPATGQPYFVIRSSGWGGGWQPGNLLRFNTVAASKPAVLMRSVSAGHSAIEQDSIRLHFRGNAQ
jgi:hypothetical protein